MPSSSPWAVAANPPAASRPSHAVQIGFGDQWVRNIAVTVSLGPNTGQSFQGILSTSIGQDAAIDSGSAQFQDGSTSPIVGQAHGRSIRLRIGIDPNSILT